MATSRVALSAADSQPRGLQELDELGAVGRGEDLAGGRRARAGRAQAGGALLPHFPHFGTGGAGRAGWGGLPTVTAARDERGEAGRKESAPVNWHSRDC
ncbi:hypothetical protein GCM10022255_078780 [Dactylosporangium darangshiense]|uniref:Uncharacterized protein n=1 Tax=Dactylosporangium darangshiense TaxID=579108 RepID=A0ABP8DKP6_9ACTN